MSLVIDGSSAINITTDGGKPRIVGDFSNSTIANRVAFQTSTTNGNTSILAIPNGTGNLANFSVQNSSDAGNASRFQIVATSTDARLNADLLGTGTYLPMTFYTGGWERMRIDTSGNVGIGGLQNASSKLEVAGTNANNAGAKATYEGTIKINEGGLSSLQATGGLEFKGSVFGSGYGSKILGSDDGQLLFGNRANSATWSECMRLDTSGNLQFNSGYGSVATAYGCRAWVNFDGTFATSPFTIANGGIRGAGNVTSVTDNGLGDYTVNFTNAMPDANYSTVITSERGSTGSTAGAAINAVSGQTQYNTLGVRISNNTSSGRSDPVYLCVSIFR